MTWRAPNFGTKWTKADYVHSDIQHIMRTNEYWMGKKHQADMYIKKNLDKIAKLEKKLKELES